MVDYILFCWHTKKYLRNKKEKNIKIVKLSSLKDAETFFLNKYSKIEYEVVRREKGGITLISATISGRTYARKTESIVFIKA